MWLLKYVAIVILIIYTIIDFVNAVTASDDDKIKKATNRALKRAILCIVIFLLPMLLEFILQFIDDRAADLCGIGTTVGYGVGVK